MLKSIGVAAALAGASLAAAPFAAHAADEAIVDCADAPAHRDCGQTRHFPVEAEAQGVEEYRKLKARLFDPEDPVAQALALSKWGDPSGYEDSDAEASFIYAIDKANCVYAQADRVFYYDEGGPNDGGSNEVTPRAVIYYLNNIAPRSLAFTAQGVFSGAERLLATRSTVDPDRMAKAWAEVYGRHCKGK